MEEDFIFDVAPAPCAHASTLAETEGGLIAAWFGGSCEGHDDVGIWSAEQPRGRRRWSEPRRVADGGQWDGRRFPCWNPVLHQARNVALLLFYKVGPSPSRWWGMMTRSADSGRTWEAPQRLPSNHLGPIKNKPVETADGMLICPSSSEHGTWRVHLEYARDGGRHWDAGQPLACERSLAAIQPTLLVWPNKGFQLLCRTRQGFVGESRSDDGLCWSPLRASTLPNPDSGIDGVVLRDGRGLLVQPLIAPAHTAQRRGELRHGPDVDADAGAGARRRRVFLPGGDL